MDARAVALALGAVLVGAPACAQDNPACAQFQEPLAYNACLARQGQPARATHRTPEPAGAASAVHGPRRGRAYGMAIPRQGKHGRMQLEFTVEPRRR